MNARFFPLIFVAPLFVVACDHPSPPTVAADKNVDATAPSATTNSKPPPSAPPANDAMADATFALPPLDDGCAKDGDCDAITDNVSGTYVCCPGCTNTIASVGWIKAVHAACAAHPPNVCPPIGCAMAVPHPKCVAGHCVDAK